jgi:hypothetical protein
VLEGRARSPSKLLTRKLSRTNHQQWMPSKHQFLGSHSSIDASTFSFITVTILSVSFGCRFVAGNLRDAITDRLVCVVPYLWTPHSTDTIILIAVSVSSLTCRTRKLKCDEQKPQCSQCRKASRECRPSEGIVFRHQQNASMNKSDEDGSSNRGGLKGFYSYKNTFDEDSVWLEIPKQGALSTITASKLCGAKKV